MNGLLAEHEVLLLTRDLSAEGLRAADVGVLLLVHPAGDGVPPGYKVEVATITGETVAVVDLTAGLVHPSAERDVRHAREAVSNS